MLGPFPEYNKKKCPKRCADITEACPEGARKQGGGVCGPKCKWQTNDFCPCDKPCGTGQQTRQALCVVDTCKTFAEAESLSRKKNPCKNQCSLQTKPVTSQSCNTQACPPKCKWQTNDFCPCDKPCGGGVQTRQALCVVDTCNTFAEAESLSRKPNPCKNQCSRKTKPTTSQVCNTQPCGPKCKWQAGDFCPCSKPCGGGEQTRQSLCVVDTCKTFAEAESLSRKKNPCKNKCEAETKPPTSQPCNTEECELKCKLVVAPRFGRCSAKCGGGIRTKKTYCIPDLTPESQIESFMSEVAQGRPSNPCEGMCPPPAFNTSEPCNTQECGPQTITVCEKSIKRQAEDSAPTGNWVLYTRTPTSFGFFRPGPAVPPGGVDDKGSFESTTPTGGDKLSLFNFDHAGQPLSTVSNILYDTFRTAGPAPVVTSLNIVVVGTTNPEGFTSLVFEPIYNTVQGPLIDNVWQQWDAYLGGAAIWWSSKVIPGAPLGPSSFVPLSVIIAANPTAIIQAVGLNQGSGNGGLISAVSYFKFTSGKGAFTYNFEAQCSRK
jgi:hypothetical protein